ncbi:hypothetical protein [Arthrobacter sp. zg-Y895]|uniref:hypothetical protein n=1 Tax=Arthrobacter sp. zg-Y895 TaxID=2886933 RepID=UPI001D13A8CC|nr:hypothetical protein [Arthrobacter sp. zg-Y895]MCC3302166.1 hypothetical protein [Arthrobacter sp. zg-Y895]
MAAAILAFIRLGHQVDETRRGNDEIARKNGEDQWWDTLKWTYTEAKESQAKDSTFRTVAAARTLDSLNQDRGNLTVQQQRAVESILDMFGESKEPEVEDAVAPIYRSLGRIAPRELDHAVFEAIEMMGLTATLEHRKGHSLGEHSGVIWDGVLTGPNGNEVIVEIAGRYGIGRFSRLTDYINEAPNRWAVVVFGSRVSKAEIAQLRGRSSRVLPVIWGSKDSSRDLAAALDEALKA